MSDRGIIAGGVETDEKDAVVAALERMVADESMHTESSYSANADLYPDHKIPFIEKHLAYLKSHPSVNPDHYLANLRLMIRRRG